jgi:4'-phosphopantetheinyl transferase
MKTKIPALEPRREAWLPAPPDLNLCGDEIHVWRAHLEDNASTVDAFWPALSVPERRRAERFHFDRDRCHFVIARGILRNILSRYLRSTPAQISFTYNQYGKPALSATKDGLHFNVSHSHGAALYAFTRACQLGIDLELLRDDFASLEIARRFFSAAEVSVLRSQQASQQTQAFFNCWTRKEAYIKALGEGLSHPLDRFSVSLTPDEHACLISTDNDSQEAANWSIIDLSPFPGYAAALAVRRRRPILRCWEWQV